MLTRSNNHSRNGLHSGLRQSLSRLFCFASLAVFTFGITFLPTSTFAQEDAGQAAAPENFNACVERWNELEAQLAQLETQLDADAGNEELSTQYTDLVNQAGKLVDTMRDAAPEALKTDSGNIDVLRNVLGLMVNDARFGRDGKVLELGDHVIQAGVNPRLFSIGRSSNDLSVDARGIFDELTLRSEDARADLPRVRLNTTQGEITFELFEDDAPNAVANFISLIDAGFYDGIVFHRVLEGFMAQTGCPDGNGLGGPGYTINCECSQPGSRKNYTGTLSMAHAGVNTGGSQFFLNFSRNNILDRKHTVFGRIVDGWDVLDRITRTHIDLGGGVEDPIPDVVKDKIVSAEVLRRRDHKYVPVTNGGDPLPPKNMDSGTDDPETNEEEPVIEQPGVDEPSAEEPEMEQPEEGSSTAPEATEEQPEENAGGGDEEMTPETEPAPESEPAVEETEESGEGGR